jgi:outer membrane lipoprotein-sorting protein
MPLVASALAILLLVGWAGSFDALRREGDAIRSIQAEFTQHKEMRMLVRPIVSEGRFYFQKPGSLRWEYTSPVKSVLLMHDGSVRRFFQQSGDWTEDTTAGLQAMDVVMEEITRWLNGRFDDNPVFLAELVPGRLIRLTPKSESMAGIIQRIELVLADRPGVLEQVVIYESEASLTRLLFSGSQVNLDIPESVFLTAQ